jgi:hypothetical protein
MSRAGLPLSVVNKLSSRPATRGHGVRTWEALTVASLLVLAIVVRRPAYVLSHSFWVDEGCVANSVRAPTEQVPLLSWSTPIGWTLLLAKLGTSAQTPMAGLVLARFQAGRP